MMRRWMRASGTLIVASLLAAPALAAPIVIDDFTDPTSAASNQAQTGGDTLAVFANKTGIATSSTIGGVRELYAQNVTSSGANYGNNAQARYATSGGAGLGQFGNASSLGQAFGSFNWDGAANNTGGTKGVVGNGLGNIDLTGGGSNSEFRFYNWSVVGSTGPRMTITVNTATGTLTRVVDTHDTDPNQLSVQFVSFTGTGDFTQVTGIQVFFEATTAAGAKNGSDISFTLLEATSGVPEPSTIALALMGGAGLFFAARRRK